MILFQLLVNPAGILCFAFAAPEAGVDAIYLLLGAVLARLASLRDHASRPKR